MKKISGLLGIIFILFGCATYQSTGQKLTWAQQQHKLAKITSWQINGSVGFKYVAKTTMANLNWRQNNDNYEITLYSLLDLVSVKLVGDRSHVVFWKSATEQFTAKTPENLMMQQLGWSLPVTNLRFWVRGLPAPKYCYKATFNKEQNLITLEQQGWQISYQRYAQVDNIDLPSKLILRHDQIEVKIIIKNWQI